MARIKHIALATQDPEATAKFYIDGLGLKEVGKVNSPTAEGYYLTGGYINLAILKFKFDDPATTEGELRYTGIHHFGFKVEDMDEALKLCNGFDRYLYRSAIPGGDFWPLEWVVDAKPQETREIIESIPLGTRIAHFHGKPRPHEVQRAWLKEWQKEMI